MRVSLFALLAVARADQNILQQPHITPPKHSRFRELVWGELNFLHTTDTHGWYAGHLNQKQYSGDWGDFISFSTRLREEAALRGSDLLVVDTGDKHDGNGLSDATIPNGNISTGIFNRLDYDLVTIGNHELYTADASIMEYEISVQKYGEKYVSTNVEYQLDDGTWVPFGNKYRYFETLNTKSRVLALSFLFDFRRFNSRSRVTPIENVLKQEWFNEILGSFPEEKLDYLVVFGHIPVTDLEQQELLSLHIHLRRHYPSLVIQYFGGHSHIRDFAVYDHAATGLQSGRYCETVGWLSINSTADPPVFNRRYIDFNRESFMHHSTADGFDTGLGVEVKQYITEQRLALNITYIFGYVPQTYLANSYPYGHPLSIYTLLNSTILPSLIGNELTEVLPNRLILVNSGSIRYDLYKGNFTRDTEFIVSPFVNEWNVIALPKELALAIAPYLNRGRFILQDLAPPETKSILYRQNAIAAIAASSGSTLSCPAVHEKGLKYGLTTIDEFGCDGDDVIHNSLPYYPSPNIIDSYIEGDSDTDEVDVVFYDFIQPYILAAINALNKDTSMNFSDRDVRSYGGDSVGALLRKHFTD